MDKLNLQNLGYIILFTFFMGSLFTYLQLNHLSEEMAKNNALTEAEQYAEMFKSFHGLYSSEVVAKVVGQGQMKIAHDYQETRYDSLGGAIPLPAILSIMLADKMNTETTSIKLCSKHAFPGRRDHKLSAFELRALEHFEANSNSDDPFYEFDENNNLLNYAIPDKIATSSCVNCHNNDLQIPKTNWQLGDVQVAIFISRPLWTDTVTAIVSETFLRMGLLAVVIVGVLWIVIHHIWNVKLSIQDTKGVIEQLKSGDLPEQDAKVPQNEMREVVEGLNLLWQNFKNVASFAESVGKGNLSVDFQKLSERDSLGTALLCMRDNLQQIAIDEKKRSWATTGLAQLGDILHAAYINTDDLFDNIARFIVKYTDSNQAGLFLFNDENDEEKFLELVACYAYDKRKYLEKRIESGQGLVGICALEKEILHMTNVPEGYINITSGLGEATATNLILVPLLFSEEVHGVLEMASFQKFEGYQIEFLKKIAESIASAVFIAKGNQRTRKLLEESQSMTERLRAQEEEMLQNAEELQAAQEDTERQLKEIEAEKKKSVAIMEGCVDGILTFNREGQITFCNKAAEEILQLKPQEVIGQNIRHYIPLELVDEATACEVYYSNGSRKKIDIRTEVSIKNAAMEDIDVLLTLTQADLGDDYLITIFMQKISVELF